MPGTCLSRGSPIADALARLAGGEPEELEPLGDELELAAHEVSAARARARGGRS